MEQNKQIKTENSIVIQNQNFAKITGVKKVNSATTSSISIKLDGVGLSVSGNDLSVSLLDIEKGIVELSGNILSAKYSGALKNKENFFKRIFK